jgi:hypothetical protein
MSRVLTLLLATALGALLVPAGAGAAPRQVPNPLSQVPVRAATTQGRFHGRLAVDSFTGTDGGLVAIGTLRGTLDDRRYPGPQAIFEQDWQLPVGVAPVAGSDCAQLDIGIDGKATRFLSLRATIPAGVIRIRTTPRSSRLLREVTCAVNAELTGSGGHPTGALLHMLDALAHVPPEPRP